ncbi:MAG TPA: hypothetical protein DCZ01_01155 [Elusimicrobia bacterium]|nr:MAG: hypothetical protein A2X37_03255 [Elusimicrobia bacterium GWA2_66_18]OGR70343.1 MAG: hypothetical protein A2X40_04200 [Elusimicrobia bacterium GWC2_65_9]HAZ07141.1 hypothetical protein [Elusimicrobiota bacterium]
MRAALPALYRDAALYGLVHDEGADDEVWLLDLLARKHGNGGKTALEPACGTGRYLAGLLRRGWRVMGYDLSREMVEFARRRLSRWGKRAAVARGDMASFRPKERYDLAFNLLSTFRHLMTDREALRHLRVTAEALNPGGVFVLGLDLAAYGEEVADEEVWTARSGGRTAKHVMMTIPAEPRRRREKIINFVESGGKMLESAYDLRSYDAAELSALLARSPFRVAACYGYDGRPAELGAQERALWLVLKARQPLAAAQRRASRARTRREKAR